MAQGQGQEAAQALEEWAQGLAAPEAMGRVAQHQMLTIGRLQDAAAVLQHFNDFSQRTLDAVGDDLAQAAAAMLALKADLEHVFQRTRAIKHKLQKHFPSEYQATTPAEEEAEGQD